MVIRLLLKTKNGLWQWGGMESKSAKFSNIMVKGVSSLKGHLTDGIRVDEREWRTLFGTINSDKITGGGAMCPNSGFSPNLDGLQDFPDPKRDGKKDSGKSKDSTRNVRTPKSNRDQKSNVDGKLDSEETDGNNLTPDQLLWKRHVGLMIEIIKEKSQNILILKRINMGLFSTGAHRVFRFPLKNSTVVEILKRFVCLLLRRDRISRQTIVRLSGDRLWAFTAF